MIFLIQRWLEESAARAPERVAIVDRDRTLTYAELDRESAALAGALRELGVRRGDRVGIHAKKTWRSVVALFGILRAGAAYVPLDPGAPPARVAYTIADCGIRVVIGSERLLVGLALHAPPAFATAIAIDGPSSDDEAPRRIGWDRALAASPFSEPHAVETDLAYVLYTSGSTGTPKGVAIDHRAAITFVDWAVRRFELGPDDRVTSHAPLHFDLSTFDLFATIAAGATIVLVPDGTATFPFRLAELLERERITVTYLVPSALSMMVEHGDLARRDLSALRTVLFAGEVFPLKYLRAWLERAPQARFFNLYGPTETNVCTYHEVDREDARTRTDALPIGAPIDDVDAFVVGEGGEVLTEPGAIGELWVRGAGLARGYFGDPDKTARGFVQSPLAVGVAERAYRTGDRVRIEPDRRSYAFLGRVDHCVKTRGYRVELGEIEAALDALDVVSAACAVAVPDELVGHRIHAFVVLAEGASLAPGELERACGERLPKYMVPESFELLPSLPLTSSGKIDRRALLERASPARPEEVAA